MGCWYAIEDLVIKLCWYAIQKFIPRGTEVLGEREEFARWQLFLFRPLAVTLGHVLGGFTKANSSFVETVAVEIIFGFLQLGLFGLAGDDGCRVPHHADKRPIGVVRSDAAAELAKEAEVVGKDYLLVVGKGLGEEDFNDFHPVAHVETDEEVVENEELEIGFV